MFSWLGAAVAKEQHGITTHMAKPGYEEDSGGRQENENKGKQHQTGK